MLARHCALVTMLTLAGCGGSQLQATDADTSPPPPSGSAAPNASTPESKKTLGEHREDFMRGCTTEVPGAPDYCECAWDHLQKVFGDDMEGEADPKKMESFKQRISAACVSKLPESTIKENYVKGCVGEQTKRKDYCECTYVQFRKDLAPGDLANQETLSSPRFAAAKAKVLKACGAKLPEDVVKNDFVTACAKDSSLEKFCGCAWLVVRSKVSAAQVEAGEVDMESIKPMIDKNCARHRP